MSNVQELLLELENGNVDVVFDQACIHYGDGELSKAVFLWEQIANAGVDGRHTDSLIDLLYIYAYSEKASRTELLRWLKIGANLHECPKAMVSLGALYCGRPEIIHPMWSSMFEKQELAEYKDTEKGYALMEEGVSIATSGDLDFLDYIAIARSHHYRAASYGDVGVYSLEDLQEIKYHYEVAMWHTKMENMDTLVPVMKKAVEDAQKLLAGIEEELRIRKHPTSQAPDSIVTRLDKVIHVVEVKPLQAGINNIKALAGIVAENREKYKYDARIVALGKRWDICIEHVREVMRFINDSHDAENSGEAEHTSDGQNQQDSNKSKSGKSKAKSKSPKKPKIDAAVLKDFCDDIDTILNQCDSMIAVTETQIFDPEDEYFDEMQLQKTLLNARIKETLPETKAEIFEFYDKVIVRAKYIPEALEPVENERISRLRSVDTEQYKFFCDKLDSLYKRHEACIDHLDKLREFTHGYGE